MNKLIFVIVFISITALTIFTGCGGVLGGVRNVDTASRGLDSETQDFSNIVGKKWQLTEVWLDDKNTDFDRNVFANYGFTEVFTLEFSAENISGTGAPNRYGAPYTLGEGQNITIMLLFSTMMAPIYEPEGLREHTFFDYLHNAYEWSFSNNKLRLMSKTTDDLEIVLIFSL